MISPKASQAIMNILLRLVLLVCLVFAGQSYATTAVAYGHEVNVFQDGVERLNNNGLVNPSGCCSKLSSRDSQDRAQARAFFAFAANFDVTNSAAGNAAHSVNAQAALKAKLSALEKAQQTAATTRQLPDGRIRYYGAETPARNPGATRGASYVTEWNPKTGDVRSWMESYDQAGNVNRVHPKMINGQSVDAQHYPPTARELGAQ